MTDFDNVISFESLYRAHRRARLGKRHKKEVVQFENNLSENLWALHRELADGTYRIGGYHKFTIYDPKEREIQAISYRDRVVQHSLCDNYLIPLLERHLIYDNVACRQGKGSSQAIKRLRQFLVAHYRRYGRAGYFVKIDVSKYFNSISHTVLKQKLSRLVREERMTALVYSILDSYNGEQDVGLPMGNQSSQCFALLYLDCLDRYFKEVLGIKHYLRYMDDIIAIVPNKRTAVECLGVADEMLGVNRLRINPKSQVASVKNGINFLGWRFFLCPDGTLVQKLGQSTRRRVKAKVKYIRYQICVHKLSAHKAKNSLMSYQGFFDRGDAFEFVEELRYMLS